MSTTGFVCVPPARLFRYLVFILVIFAASLGAGQRELAQATPQVGIYWDSGYLENSITTDTYPDLVTGYLVLHDPPSEAGIVAWECCAQVEGPAEVLSWTLEGQALNVEDEPCFAVAIGADPLPSTGDVLLATFLVQITEPLPVTLSLVPLYFSSLPDQMSFIMADQPDVLVPMESVTGDPEVAWINRHIPNLLIDPPTLHFIDTPLGSTVVQTVTVTNAGAINTELNVALVGDCDSFALPGLSGLVIVPPGEHRGINVAFTAESLDMVFCNLSLSPFLDEVQMVGSGADLEIAWEAPTELDFGPVGLGNTVSQPVTIRNTGEAPILIDPSLVDCSPVFDLPNGNFVSTIEPGSQRTIFVSFQPAEADTYSCFLGLGDIVPDVHLTGVGMGPIVDWVAPTSYDFGLIGVGWFEWWTFLVTNTGNVPIQVDPFVPDTTEGFRVVAGPPTNLGPGLSMSVIVEFHPLYPGTHSADLEMGAIIPAIALKGESFPRLPEWWVHPDTLDFDYVFTGSFGVERVEITNAGGTWLDLDVFLQDPDQGFFIFQGAGTYPLEPGGIQEVDVVFQPLVAGYFETVLNLGPELDPVPVVGWAEDSEFICLVEPGSLVFSPVEVGDTQALSFAVTNTGSQPLEIAPRSDSSVFFIDSPDRILESGQTATFPVLFQPVSPGTFTATIDLGEPFCQPVHLTGTATSGGHPWENLVGIFFDSEYSYIETQTFGPNEVVEGYLVLIQPSESSGVAAWELAVGIDGNAEWLNWDIEGQHLNIGQDGEFIVGLGAPLPYSEAILLASFQLLVAEPFPSTVFLELGPIQNPSLPGQMVWLPWQEPNGLIPLQSFTGSSVVAFINQEIVGIGRPAPLATVSGGSVELEWPAPTDLGDGCHLYRRDEAGDDRRLTDQPLAGFGSTLYFTDHPNGYAAGTVLYYSYSVVTDGIESDRSQETEIRLTGLPAVQTRLLPNVPNPFNPQTEIRFELEKPQSVRVSIYDVTGRLVKILADGQLDGGPHVRIWQGHDTSGRQVPSGAYYVRLETESRVYHQKIMLLK